MRRSGTVAAPIEFYFEFASPYGYLASTRIDAIAGRHGREVFWHPIMLGAAFKLTGAQPLAHIPLKGDYMMRDLPRFARLLGVPFTAPPVMPTNSLAASRAFVWLQPENPGLAKQLAKGVLHAHWGLGRDIGSAEQVAEIAGGLGVDRQALLDAVGDQRIKDRLREQTQAAIERGVFGSPFVFVDGEPFWGADRLGQVERWLAAGGW
jgi:2-hydroxychromene-2-carboxylate isomerase